MKVVFILGTFLLGLTGCRTLSDDSPAEIQAASAAIDRAQKADIDNTMPVAMEAAQRKFDRSLDLLSDSEKFREDGKIEQADAAKAQAIRLANESKNIADSGVALMNDAESFDKSLATYVPVLERARQTASLQGQVQSLQNENADLMAQNERLASALPADFSISKPLAFFRTGSSKIEGRYRSDIEGVAKSMKENPDLVLTLEGFADPRGSSSYNKKLAEKRAQEVQQELIKNGVAQDRIKINVLGAVSEGSSGRNPAEMQLDRKVVAKFSSTAH